MAALRWAQPLSTPQRLMCHHDHRLLGWRADRCQTTSQTANGFGITVSQAHGQTTVKSHSRRMASLVEKSLIWCFVEPMTGIEPAYSAWECEPPWAEGR